MQNYDLKSLFPTFSVIEGYEIQAVGSINAGTGNLVVSDFSSNYPKFDSIVKNQIDMCNNIFALKAKMGDINNDDILDADGKMKTAGRLVDVARQDVQNILVQQNTLYMIGTLTIATLLITAIFISKK
jgi:hypothetical protein